MKTKNCIILFLLVITALQPMAFGEQKNNLAPVFKYESTQSFKPDLSPSAKKSTIEILPSPPAKEPPAKSSVKLNPKADKLQFQLANPKGIYLPSLDNEIAKDNKPSEETLKALDEALNKPTINEKPEFKKPITIAELKPEEKKPSVKLETKEKPSTETPKQEVKVKETSTLQPKEEVKEKIAKETAAPQPKEEVTEKIAKETSAPQPKEEVKEKIAKETSTPQPKEEVTKKENVTEEPTELKEEIIEPEVKQDPENQPNVDPEKEMLQISKEKAEDSAEDKSSPNYYLNKYSSIDKEEKKITYTSLIDAFKKSSFYTVLKNNNFKNIQLKTDNMTGDQKPEAVVNYDVPLGSDGEYASQFMVLKATDQGLDKFWVSELIPGEMDTIMVEDVNNDGKKEIVAISTTGGVSLLKSIRVYVYDNSEKGFKTIFSMNNIMEGIVIAKQGKILISETFPGGFNRAALYVWNGKIFERLEL